VSFIEELELAHFGDVWAELANRGEDDFDVHGGTHSGTASPRIRRRTADAVHCWAGRDAQLQNLSIDVEDGGRVPIRIRV